MKLNKTTSMGYIPLTLNDDEKITLFGASAPFLTGEYYITPRGVIAFQAAPDKAKPLDLRAPIPAEPMLIFQDKQNAVSLAIRTAIYKGEKMYLGDLRRMLGVSKEEVARNMRISPRTIEAYERGALNLKKAESGNVERLARMFGTTTTELLQAIRGR